MPNHTTNLHIHPPSHLYLWYILQRPALWVHSHTALLMRHQPLCPELPYSFGTQERECVNASSNKPLELSVSRHSHFTSRTDRSYPLPECKIPTPSSQQYSVEVDTCSKHPNNPNAVFAMTVRFPPIPSRVPGPGTYVV